MEQYPTFEELTQKYAKKVRPPSTRYTRPRIQPNPLRKWFARKPRPMSLVEFSRQIGTTPSYVSQLCGDDPPWPKRHIALRISVVTRGAVTPNHLAGFSRRLIAPLTPIDAE